MKNHWNATTCRKDTLVARDGSSLVLRAHLLRKEGSGSGFDEADVESVACPTVSTTSAKAKRGGGGGGGPASRLPPRAAEAPGLGGDAMGSLLDVDDTGDNAALRTLMQRPPMPGHSAAAKTKTTTTTHKSLKKANPQA